MGIPGINKFLAPCNEKRDLSDFEYTKFAVDTSGIIHKWAIGIRNSGDDMRNDNGEPISHLFAIVKSVTIFLENGILPIFVFEGKPPEVKKSILDTRSNRRTDAEEKCQQSDKNSKEYIRNFKRSYKLSHSQSHDCQKLLSFMGIPFVKSVGEADPQCAVISCHNDITGVVSEDSDMTVFGAKCQLKDFSAKKSQVTIITRYNIMIFLLTKANTIRTRYNLAPLHQITHAHYVEFANLIGSEYVNELHIKNVTVEKMFEYYVINDLCVEKTIQYMKDIGFSVHDDFLEYFRKACHEYLEAEAKDPEKINYNMSQPDREGLLAYLCGDNNLKRQDVTYLASLLNKMYITHTLLQDAKNPNDKKGLKLPSFVKNIKHSFNSISKKRDKFFGGCKETKLPDLIGKPTSKKPKSSKFRFAHHTKVTLPSIVP